MQDVNAEQRYGPTSGTVSGWVGLLGCALFAGALLWDGAGAENLRYVFGITALAVLIWSYLLRPRIVLHRGTVLELRNPLSTWWVPLALVEVVSVRAVTRITAAGEPYDAVAVGRPIRQMVRGNRPAGGLTMRSRRDPTPDLPAARSNRPDASTPSALADLMTEQVLAAADDARRDGTGSGEVRRAWAVVELGLVGACVVGLVVCLFL